MDWSYHLILVELGIVIIGRFGGTMGLVGLLRLFGYQSGISWSQVFMIGFAGLIRGAIAFGLVLRIDDTVANRSVIVTTCLTLVVFTTIFFGFTVGIVQAYLFPKVDVVDEDMSEASIHEEALHPNEEQEEDDDKGSTTRKTRGCCMKYWTRLDEMILRPLLIHNYKRDSRIQ
jgi:NhaP-type Na+/H+ or K+/H+ antiporter